jgi:hypothetical protein
MTLSAPCLPSICPARVTIELFEEFLLFAGTAYLCAHTVGWLVNRDMTTAARLKSRDLFDATGSADNSSLLISSVRSIGGPQSVDG